MKNLLLDEILDFLTSAPTLEDIIAFKPSDALQARASELLEKNRQGKLGGEEDNELDEFARMDDFMSMLKARARKKLSR
ncbi:MAG: hypothetical protein IPK17_15690 [Chloroflexi bacterium]|uniref:hypothetical protein n=1 Tax=Candidatus Flexifilum breve TaxID=3140694 RepID=UPI00313754E4|nr:hypothetical protein [Chloroflexota bacterium]